MLCIHKPFFLSFLFFCYNTHWYQGFLVGKKVHGKISITSKINFKKYCYTKNQDKTHITTAIISDKTEGDTSSVRLFIVPLRHVSNRFRAIKVRGVTERV